MRLFIENEESIQIDYEVIFGYKVSHAAQSVKVND